MGSGTHRDLVRTRRTSPPIVRRAACSGHIRCELILTFIPRLLCSRLERLERLTERPYIAEPKLDGQRAQAHIRARRTVACYSRPGRDLLRHPGMAWLRALFVARRRCHARR
jgi:hypothetical protein